MFADIGAFQGIPWESWESGLGTRVRVGDGSEPGGQVSWFSGGDWVVIYRGAVSVVLSGWSNPGA